MPHRSKSLMSTALAAALIFAPVSRAIGLESDRDQPAVVTADRSEYNEQLQQQTLIGNVLIVQGSLRVRADTIVIGLVDGALDSVNVAFGHDALMDPWYSFGSHDMLEVAHMGLHVAQMTGVDQLQLVGDARLSNPTQSLSGERIDYNMNTQAASAQGGENQVNIIIQPPQSEPQ